MHSNRSTAPASLWSERAAWLVAVVATAVFLTCLQFTVTAPFKFFSFANLVSFQAPEPFQHRVLIPAMAAALRLVVPASDALLFAFFQCLAWIALICLAYRALVMFRVGAADPVRRLLALSVVVPMILALAVPYIYMPQAFVFDAGRLDFGSWKPIYPFYYVYDVPAAVFTLGLALLLVAQHERLSKRGMFAYIVLLALATANRETAVFLVPFSALLFWGRLSLRSWLGFMLVQIAVVGLVELPLQWLFRDQVNPSPNVAFNSQYEDHLLENLGLFVNPLFFIIMIARFTAGLYLPVLVWRRLLDRRLVCALVGFVLPLIVCALIVGRLQEHRIFIETVPLIWLAAMQVIALRCGPGGNRAAGSTGDG